MDDLLGRGHTPASSAIDVDVFSQFFSEKVAKVRSSTADAPAPAFTRAPHGVSFQQFRPLTVDDVISAVRRLPDKSSAADDPIPTSVLKQIVHVIAPFITELLNPSIQAGWPATFQPRSRRHLSLRLSRSQGLMLPVRARIGRSRICLSYRSSWSVLLFAS